MLQIWAGIMRLHKCEGGGREACIVAFNNKHQSLFSVHCGYCLCFCATVREVDLRFEECPLSGLEVTPSNVAQHMGHGTWHQERQDSAREPELAQDHRYLTPLYWSNPWKVFFNLPVHKATRRVIFVWRAVCHKYIIES